MILLSANIVYAKYITTSKLNTSLKIAKPILIVEGKNIPQISETNNSGYYEFSIKNFNNTSVSEVGFLYTIEILSKNDEAIQFELYNEQAQMSLENLKTIQLSMKANEKTEHKYKLKIIYNNSKGINKKDIIEEVYIKVYSEQEQINSVL